MGYGLSKGIRAHCDIKPDNLMNDSTGTLKVTDFGLAKLIDWVPCPTWPPSSSWMPRWLIVERNLSGPTWFQNQTETQTLRRGRYRLPSVGPEPR